MRYAKYDALCSQEREGEKLDGWVKVGHGRFSWVREGEDMYRRKGGEKREVSMEAHQGGKEKRKPYEPVEENALSLIDVPTSIASGVPSTQRLPP